MSSTPTINDVAKAAGVSLSAVSFVLNGKADKYRISPTTQARIRAAITQLGFKPNPDAISKAHGEHHPHPIEATSVEPISRPVVEEIPSPEPEIAIENAPLGIEVDADVPAASAPEVDLSGSTPVFISEPPPTLPPVETPIDTPASTPEQTLEPIAETPSPVSETPPIISTPTETITPTPAPQPAITPEAELGADVPTAPVITSEMVVDADVPAASMPEGDLSGSTPVFISEPPPTLPPVETPIETPASTPEQTLEPIVETPSPVSETPPVISTPAETVTPPPAPQPAATPESEVDADVPAASAPEIDLSSSTPAETVTPTPEPQAVVTPAPVVDADVPAASAPEIDLSSPTPAETVTPTPQPSAVVTPAPVVDADVPAASAPEVDLSSSTPVFTPAETQAITPEVTIQTPETPHLNPLPPLLRPESRDYEGQAGERTDGIHEGMPDGVAGGQETTAELPAPTPEQSENPTP